MLRQQWKQRAVFLLIGALAALAVVFLTGADLSTSSPIGRYRMCCTPRGSFTEIYVIDTTNGMVKWLGSGDNAKPFQEIK